MKKFWIEVLFWLHFPIVLLWFGLFVVPKSIWPGRVTFHFWYIISIMVVQFLWSVLVFHKPDIICPLTTLMQKLRGYPLASKGNYGHSYIAELIDRLGIKVRYGWINALLVATLIIVTIQYFFFT